MNCFMLSFIESAHKIGQKNWIYQFLSYLCNKIYMFSTAYEKVRFTNYRTNLRIRRTECRRPGTDRVPLREATFRSYAPYSHFSVGAAARLANGEIITGTNQRMRLPLGALCRTHYIVLCQRSIPGASCNHLGDSGTQ